MMRSWLCGHLQEAFQLEAFSLLSWASQLVLLALCISCMFEAVQQSIGGVPHFSLLEFMINAFARLLGIAPQDHK